MTRQAKHSLTRSGILLGAATAAGTVLTIPFHLAMVRILTPAEYSLLASLFAILFIVAVPVGALQAKVAREVAGLLADGREAETGRYLREGLHSVARWLAVLCVVGGAIAVPVALALNVHDPLPAAATAVAIALNLPLPVLWGGLQGAERFYSLAGVGLAYFGLRLAVGLVLGLLGAGVGGVMVGVAVATAGTVVISALPLRRLLSGWQRGAYAGPRLMDGYAGSAAVGMCALAALTNADLLTSRISFHASVSGTYAAASLGARTLLLVPSVVTTVLFPRVATLRSRTRERSHLLAGLLVVGVVVFGATAILAAFPEPIIRIAIGAKYASAKSWLGPLALAMGLYSLGNVYFFHFLSIGRTRFIVPMVGLFCLQLVCFWLFHARPVQLVEVQIGIAAALVVAGEAFYRGARKEAAPA